MLIEEMNSEQLLREILRELMQHTALLTKIDEILFEMLFDKPSTNSKHWERHNTENPQ